ncbi:PPE domain-containing protein [Mycobacterium decipiens]|uniref:Uncharacterized protein n=1 Tax=Mycobacterium decipiens TaxID=1430326 RepID=A0A1X2LU03_9MYCO|nr:hypothetical protein [Mycobacterium decipiens]OSC40344.1 hypothetical protein B8W66_13665 [Mycobacterium decipiens]
MSAPQTLNVEHEELMARVAELEAPLPNPPSGNPVPPSQLAMVIRATAQIGLSADNMRLYLDAGSRERGRLAVSLRNAAKAYEETDEQAAQAIGKTDSNPDSGEPSGSPGTSGTSGTPPTPATPGSPGSPGSPQSRKATKPPNRLDCEPPPRFQIVNLNLNPIEQSFGDYVDLKQLARQIAAADQGVSFDAFAQEWAAYQTTLLEATYMFRPFSSWEGAAATAVESSFNAQRSWMYQMAELCASIAAQAQSVVSAQRQAVTDHPTSAQIATIERNYLSGNTELARRQYLAADAKSEETLAAYAKNVPLPLPALQPPQPPAAARITVPEPPDSSGLPLDQPGLVDGLAAGSSALSDVGSEISAGSATVTDPSPVPAGAGTGGTDNTVSSVPGAGLAPLTGSATRAAAMLPPPSLKPASATGGDVPAAELKPASAVGSTTPAPGSRLGSSAGGGGVPSIPLTDVESAARSSSATRNTAVGLGKPGSRVSGAIGGGGMGMAPVGQGAQGHGGKPKHAQRAEESLYTEKRPWTGGLIGRRRRNDLPDNMEPE